MFAERGLTPLSRQNYFVEAAGGTICTEPHTAASVWPMNSVLRIQPSRGHDSARAPDSASRQWQNRLLASLAAADRTRLLSHLAPVTLEYRRKLYDANRPIKFVHFIETGVGSLVATLRNGDAVEVGTIGNEGIVGLPVVFGDGQAPTSVYVQVPGAGLRMKADLFRQELERSASMRASMLRYAHAFFNQVAQSAACAHLHPLEQRCARWLLMTHDRMQSDEFPLTQEFLSMMLGVRRAGVTVAAGELQRAGLIRYSRGRVTMLDHEGLLDRSCECYGVSKREFDRLLGEAPKRSSPVLAR